MAIPPTTAAGSSPRGRGTPRRASGEHSCDRFIPARAGNARLTGSSFSAVSVHPRAGGERYSNHELLHFITGSSPRGRGTLELSETAQDTGRFIPARAGNATISVGRYRSRTVHPRAGGERLPIRTIDPRWYGSSPRGRGTRKIRALWASAWRFIPARAGNAVHLVNGELCAAVHPRAGGERGSKVLGWRQEIGSSPRGRGTLPQSPELRADLRFIPARAGNARPVAAGPTPRHGSSPRGRGTQERRNAARCGPRFIPARAGNATCLPSTSARQSVHPRAGGERFVRDAEGHGFVGSSPRGRGTPPRSRLGCGHRRFIPARAGNAAAPAVGSVRSTVHPRAGGERHRQTAWMGTPCGSSPRGRGTRARFSPGGAGGRFIPARAGNASCPRSAPTPMPVHPRAGGERVNSWPARSTTAGSSPRGRGTRRKSQIATAPYRFIPARAGNANGSRPPRPARSVHPRAGGERIAGAFLSALEVGSSPRGRGTLCAPRRSICLRRFIPARAGNAWPRSGVTLTITVHPRAGGERRERSGS